MGLEGQGAQEDDPAWLRTAAATQSDSAGNSSSKATPAQGRTRPRISFHKPKPVSPSSRIFLPAFVPPASKRTLKLEEEEEASDTSPPGKKRRGGSVPPVPDEVAEQRGMPEADDERPSQEPPPPRLEELPELPYPEAEGELEGEEGKERERIEGEEGGGEGGEEGGKEGGGEEGKKWGLRLSHGLAIRLAAANKEARGRLPRIKAAAARLKEGVDGEGDENLIRSQVHATVAALLPALQAFEGGVLAAKMDVIRAAHAEAARRGGGRALRGHALRLRRRRVQAAINHLTLALHFARCLPFLHAEYAQSLLDFEEENAHIRRRKEVWEECCGGLRREVSKFFAAFLPAFPSPPP